MNYYCNNKSLFIVADDFEKWDESSKILYFLMTKEARTLITFLNNSKIIIIEGD